LFVLNEQIMHWTVWNKEIKSQGKILFDLFDRFETNDVHDKTFMETFQENQYRGIVSDEMYHLQKKTAIEGFPFTLNLFK